jgi:hypothetical protein
MIIAALVAASIVLPAAADTRGTWPPAGNGLRHMSAQQKLAVIRPLVEIANECIARRVTGDPRFTTLAQAGEINGLIVDSVPSCVEAMRALIDAHDRLFGEGAGESYFMGPYLDALPGAVQTFLNRAR